MKNFPKTIASLSFSLLTIGAMAQVALPVSEAAKHHVARTFKNKAVYDGYKHLTKSPVALTYYVLNYDSADAITNSDPTHYDNQGELMNVHYVYPADTAGGNYNTINYVSVSFDSIYDPYNYTDTTYVGMALKNEYLVLDTLIVPIVQVNHSGSNDTLDISLDEVSTDPDSLGYAGNFPTVIKDTMIITQQIGAGNTSYIVDLKWALGLKLTNPRFSVRLTYSGSKMDSCYFLYGFAAFTGSCQGGTYTLANPTTWSPVDTNNNGTIGTIDENSYMLWNEYAAYGILPDNGGFGIFYDCAGTGIPAPGDGAAYEENVYVWAVVHTEGNSNAGIHNISESGLSVGQNYPNPFDKETQINYNLTKSSNVNFTIYDMTGRIITTTDYGMVGSGTHEITLSANSFSPGIYFYTFNVNGSKVTNKMVITE